MLITLYNTISRNNVVNKTLTEKYSYENCQLIGEWDEEQPTIQLVGDIDFSDVNYALLNDKYYFVKSPIEYRNNVYILNLLYDYLENEKDDFLNWYCYIKRGSIGEKYIHDPVDVFSVKKEIEFVKAGDGFGETEADGSYVLVTAQKGYTVAN